MKHKFQLRVLEHIHANIKFEHLSDFLAVVGNGLQYESGAQVSLIDKKNPEENLQKI
jgi:hypothetical protein